MLPPEVTLTEKIMEQVGAFSHLTGCNCANNWSCSYCQLWFAIHQLITEYNRERNAGTQPLA